MSPSGHHLEWGLLGIEREFNRMKWTFPLICATLALLAVSAPQAALPPWAYPNPKMASEDIDIQVRSSTKRVTEDSEILTRWDVEVVADVRTVRKSGTSLREGSRITIRYSAHHYKKPDWLGPGSQPILAEGDCWSAALNAVGEQKDRYYVPGGAPDSTFGWSAKK